MSFFIVSGLSGSGKSIALQALEDSGFYCIDNLPAVLLPHFAGLLADMRNNAILNVAIGLDVRNRAFLADLPQGLEALRARGIHYRIIFLEASDEALNTIESGLALNPNNSGLHYSRGFCWLRPPYEFPDRVEADMNMAQKLSPRDPLKVHCYGLTAQAWLASGKPGCEDKALEAFERASHEANTIWPYVVAAAALNAKLGNIERARDFLLAAISRKPDVTVAQLPNALPNPWWRASWARIADAEGLLMELGLPRE